MTIKHETTFQAHFVHNFMVLIKTKGKKRRKMKQQVIYCDDHKEYKEEATAFNEVAKKKWVQEYK